MTGTLGQVSIYIVPFIAFMFFIVCLVLYLDAKRQNKRNPESFNEDQMDVRKFFLCVASVLMGIILFIAIGLMWLTYVVLTNM